MANATQDGAEVVYLDAAAATGGHRVGRLVRFDGTQLWVDFPGNPHGPVCAQSTVALTPKALVQAIQARLPVLLAFLEERSDQPVVIGLLQHPVAAEPGTVEPDSSEHSALAMSVDGRRVTLEAQDEVVVRCGEASITLRRNGRLAIRGVYVETRARGTHRIKGGNVQIN